MSSIRKRLTLTLGIVLSLSWGAAALILYLGQRDGLVSEFDHALTAAAQALEPLTEQSWGRIKFEPAGELRPEFGNIREPDYFQFWLADGSALGRSPSLRGSNLIRQDSHLNEPKFWNLVLPDGLPGRAIVIRFVPQEDEDSPKGLLSSPRNEVTLVVARHRAELDQRLNLLSAALALGGVGIVVTTPLVVFLAVRHGLDPLSRLAERAATIDGSSLQLRFPTEAMPTELLPIVERLNDLLTRLEASFARERRFGSDLAHELRTPVAELRAATEVALKWPDDPSANTEALKESLQIAKQMEAIVRVLLLLARCENGTQIVSSESIAFGDLVCELWSPLAKSAIERRLHLRFDVPANVVVHSDRTLLSAILLNLFKNGLDYTPEGGPLRIAFEGTAFFVENASDNLTEIDLPHLFERLWRKDTARTSSEHAGLGLALAQAYAKALGLRLSAQLRAGGILRITLSDFAVEDGASARTASGQ
jgi:signal transduction histidine kinase